jgi:glycosyltransferase involved in cell wall biosynthesis
MDHANHQLRELYERAMIFVFPSKKENFPVVLLEAMSSANAIITTAGTGCAEVVGDSAMLVNAGDTDGIREMLIKLINNEALCSELGHAARKRVENKFGWPTIATHHIALYKKYSPFTVF